MRFLIITACLAAFVAYVITETCHKDDDVDVVCDLISCNGNNTVKSCEHSECTCIINTDIYCSSRADCDVLPLTECKVTGHEGPGGHGGPDGPGHHHTPHGHDDGVIWHCLDTKCSCF
ncbi:serine protease inhibitor Cvsi-2-like [Mizuhopecten yessoensis]|uniref:Uncharacterized protein n=1 Tax=Mizuhopecten yessoensis TaxID=6573 RepID=A0A210Q8X3_MIZYE|nr:serine protease inhibitor Cvsi-2-like [Mizuhopecten yessoensis]OWF45200.1 hypothetical protein KP79_PYT23595 [Mizuhopecten yessoensis]